MQSQDKMSPELDAAFSGLSMAMTTLQGAIGVVSEDVRKLSESNQELVKSLHALDKRSAEAREEMQRAFAEGLAKNRECIHRSNEENRKAHERLSEEIRGAKSEASDAIAAIKDHHDVRHHEITLRVSEVETAHAKTKVRDATAFTVLSFIGTLLALLLTGKFQQAWQLITSGG